MMIDRGWTVLEKKHCKRGRRKDGKCRKTWRR